MRALEEAQNQTEDKPLTPMKRRDRGGSKKKSPSKKRAQANRRGGLSSELSKMLDELESDPIPLDEMMKV